MPATRSRTSTEQAAEVASEEVKQQPQDEAEPVVAKPVDQEAEAEAAPVAVPEVDEAVPVVTEEEPKAEESVPAVVASEENGTSEAVSATESLEQNGNSAEAESVEEPAKRKSDAVVVGGEGDGPDSTEPVVAKKAKVDDDVVAEAPAEATA